MMMTLDGARLLMLAPRDHRVAAACAPVQLLRSWSHASVRTTAAHSITTIAWAKGEQGGLLMTMRDLCRRPISRRRLLEAGGGALALATAAATPLRWARAQQKVTCRIAHVEAIGSPLTEALEKWTQ